MAATTPFTYNPATPSDADLVRQLIPDTVNTDEQPAIFNDYEIANLFTIQRRQFQSSMFFSGPAGRNLPLSPVSLLRVAAIGVDIIANSTGLTAQISKLLDVSLKDATRLMGDRAQRYREIDDEAGAFAIVEQVTTSWAFQQRFWSQVQRQQGGGGL